MLAGTRYGGLAALAVLLWSVGISAGAQVYPTKPIRLISPFAPGGPNDIIARFLAQRLAEPLGQPIVVDNRGGAGGNLGTDLVAKSTPDGYTLVMAGAGSLTINPHIGKVPYDSLRDFAPVTLVAIAPHVLAVHPGVPAKSVADLVQLAKTHPRKLNYASGGVGSSTHLAGELFKVIGGVDIVHIAYKGTGPALADVLGGQVQMVFSGIPTVLPHARSGKLRALGTSMLKRVPALPEVPSIAETLPAYEMNPWYGVLAPARTPRAIVRGLHEEIVRAASIPEFSASLTAQGATPVTNTPEAFSALIKDEMQKWGRLIRSAGISAN
jgi:tripartite-type tricarboxylate transporter receptor subunit TctC